MMPLFALKHFEGSRESKLAHHVPGEPIEEVINDNGLPRVLRDQLLKQTRLGSDMLLIRTQS